MIELFRCVREGSYRNGGGGGNFESNDIEMWTNDSTTPTTTAAQNGRENESTIGGTACSSLCTDDVSVCDGRAPSSLCVEASECGGKAGNDSLFVLWSL